MNKTYIAIDLKSFYASVECKERNLNALTTNLVVADLSRTSKTICLAVSPSLKQYGLSGRSRLYEVESKVKEINKERRKKINYKSFTGKSFNDVELKNNLHLELDYIVAKHIKENKDGVRIAELDEMSYRKLLWNYKPITDFWRVGRGIAKRLAEHNIYTMGDIARTSLNNEELLYKLFGINAELLIDHAWGYEPCTILDIKKFKPKINSLSSGQVLHTPYDFKKARIIVSEMTDLLVLDLVDKNVVTNQIGLIISYDTENIENGYKGDIEKDRYGRLMPKESKGIVNLDRYTSSTKIITDNMLNLYDKIIKKNISVRRINIVFNNIIDSLKASK